MKNELMNQLVNRLNELSADHAEEEFIKCCGSKRWARSMASGRPFNSIDDLLTKADSVWWSLSEEDWLEAFRAHPKIGEKKAAATQSEQARNWSAAEQSGMSNAAAEVTAALAEGNREYEECFGFIYIVCATGRTPEEMLTILKARLQNDAATELRNAAKEQGKITRLRLEKLLKQ
jgi:OHCU decarboxylase